MINRYPRLYKALAIGIIALAIRLISIAILGRETGIDPGMDAVAYDRFARLMMSGWEWISTPLAVREPFYPAFLAFCYVLPGPEIGVMQFFQALLGAATAVIVYLSLRTLVRESIAIIAALLIAVHPTFVVYTPEPFRENLIIPLFACSLAVFLLAMVKRSIWRLFLFALFYTLLIHTDVRYLPLIAVIPVMVYAFHKQPKIAVKQSLWMWFFIVLLMIPYQIRGYVAMGEPVIVTERFLGRWLDRVTKVSKTTAEDTGDKRQIWLEQFEAKKQSTWEELCEAEQQYFLAGGRPNIGRVEVHWDLFKEFWRFMRFKPMYRPYPDGRFSKPWSFRHNLASSLSLIPFFLFLPFILIGSSRKSRQVAWPLVIFLLAYSIMHIFVHAIERYRIPMEVITSVLLAMALVNFWSLMRRKQVSPDE